MTTPACGVHVSPDVLLRRESSSADLTVTSTPVTPCGVFDFDLAGARTELVITADRDSNEATALASMRRGRKAVHEEVWAQLFIDDVFIDVVRTAEIDDGEPGEGGGGCPDPSFLGRFIVPPLYLDGELHRARVCFMTRLSRSSPRLDADADESGIVATTTAQGPEATAEADFSAKRAARPLRSAR